MEKKRWQAALALILLVTAIVTFITFPVTKVEQAKFIRDSEMADKLNDEQLASLDKFTPVQRVERLPLCRSSFASLALVLGAFFVYLFFKVGGARATTCITFSGVAQASILDMVLGGVLKGALILLKKTMLVHTGLTMFFPGLDFRSLPFIVLSQFDFFSLWYLVGPGPGDRRLHPLQPQKEHRHRRPLLPFQEPDFHRLFVLHDETDGHVGRRSPACPPAARMPLPGPKHLTILYF